MSTGGHKQHDHDAARAIKFMALKILAFGILPVLVAALIVYWRLG